MDAVKLLTRFAVCLLIGAGLMTGCGQSPVSSKDETGVPVAAKPAWKTGQASSISAEVVAVAPELRSAGESNYYTPRKGVSLGAAMKRYGTSADVRVKSAYFEAEPNSLVGAEDPVLIDMTVYSGTTLSDVQVAFGPAGSVFEPAAILGLTLTGPITAEDVFDVNHIAGDGTFIESIETEIAKNGEKFIRLRIRVPGFSRYTLNGGNR